MAESDLDPEAARAFIPLKHSTREPEQVRRVLRDWLRPRVGAGPDLMVSAVSEPTGTGVANETLMFEATWSEGALSRTQGFVARLANDSPLYIEADIETHAKIYEALADAPGVPVPRVYGYEGDPSLLGSPFFVMERMDGRVPGDSPHWREAGFVLDASPEHRRAMWENAVRVLAALHQVDVSRFGFLASEVATSGLADHLAYWRRYLDHGERGVPFEVLERGHDWLARHLPEPAPTGFSWGDARFANIMFRGDEVVSIFDWDTASLAGPEADLAWWRFMDGPASELMEGIGTPDELVERWESHTGRKARDLEWHDVFTSFRLGVVLLNLFSNMAAAGQLSAEVAEHQAREGNQPASVLKAQLDAMGER